MDRRFVQDVVKYIGVSTQIIVPPGQRWRIVSCECLCANNSATMPYVEYIPVNGKQSTVLIQCKRFWNGVASVYETEIKNWETLWAPSGSIFNFIDGGGTIGVRMLIEKEFVE